MSSNLIEVGEKSAWHSICNMTWELDRFRDRAVLQTNGKAFMWLNRRAVHFLLVFSILSSSIPSFGTTNDGTYFHSCDGLLEAVQTARIEDFFAAGATDPTTIAQLLRDSGILFSKEFHEALLSNIEMRVAQLPDFRKFNYTHVLNEPGPSSSPQPKELVAKRRYYNNLKSVEVNLLIQKIKELADLKTEDFDAFAVEVLMSMEVIAKSTENRALGEATRIRISRMVGTILANNRSGTIFPVFRDAVRLTLLKTAKELFLKQAQAWKDKEIGPLDYMFVLANMVGAAAFLADQSVNLLNYIFGASPFHDRPANLYVFMIIASVFGGSSVGMFSAFKTHELVFPRFWKSRFLNKSATQLGSLPEQIGDQNVNSLLNEYETSIFEAGAKILKVCKSGQICDLSPLQIAYLGHLELLELEITKQDTKAALEAMGIGGGFESIQQAAEALKANPNSLRNQIIFKSTITSLIKNFDQIEDAARAAVDKIKSETEELQHALAQLTGNQYQLTNAQLTDANLNKSELFLIKLQTDLKILTGYKTEQINFVDWLEFVRPKLNELNAMVADANSPDRDWENYANTVLNYLNQFNSEP